MDNVQFLILYPLVKVGFAMTQFITNVTLPGSLNN